MRIRKRLLVASLLIGLVATALSIIGPELLRFYKWGSVEKQPVYPWVWPVEVPADWPEAIESAGETGFSYEKVTAGNREDKTRIFLAGRMRMGWPLNVVEGGWTQIVPLPLGAAGPTTQYGLWRLRLGRGMVLIPCRPMAWMLLFNILIWAVAAYGTGVAFAAWRRGRLRERGRCVGCGYPLSGGAVCPECGRAEA